VLKCLPHPGTLAAAVGVSSHSTRSDVGVATRKAGALERRWRVAAGQSLHGLTAVAMALVLACQRCASPGTPVKQTVLIETPGCATARREFHNDRGEWQLAAW